MSKTPKTPGITKKSLEKIFTEMLDPLTGYKHLNSMEDLKKSVKLSVLPNKRYYVYLSFPDDATHNASPVKFRSLQDWRDYNKGPTSFTRFCLSNLNELCKENADK